MTSATPDASVDMGIASEGRDSQLETCIAACLCIFRTIPGRSIEICAAADDGRAGL
eukprot:COSAG06_NODE_123_length_23014_cov_10.698058_8_plen_56_part_00